MSPRTFRRDGVFGSYRIQELLEDVRELLVSKLKDEMRELQERQARIENAYSGDEASMRNEAGGRYKTATHYQRYSPFPDSLWRESERTEKVRTHQQPN